MPRRPSDLILAIDIGTSSVRSAFFDHRGEVFPKTVARAQYAVRYSQDGGAELAPLTVKRAAASCVAHTLARAPARNSIRAVAGSAFWHNLLGLDSRGKPITPIFSWADARCIDDAKRLRERFSEGAIQTRTGCMLRFSFWPAKLRWLRRTQPRLFARVARWVSPSDWIWTELFGTTGTSVSMVSATGLYDQIKRTWDEELCTACQVRPDQLPRLGESGRFTQRRLNELRDAEIFFPLGDGAAGNLGSGADRPGLLAVNVGTSAAARTVHETDKAQRRKLPFGLFCYALDANQSLIGGAVSNAGNLRAWCLRELRLRDNPQAIRPALACRAAADDSICVLPFWVSERAPTWPEKLRGTIVGLTQATSAEEISRATTTSVFNRLAQIIELTESTVGKADRVVVSGGILQSMPTLQLLSDVIARDLEICPMPEASLRGAAIYALKTLGHSPASLRKGRMVRHDRELAAKHRRRRKCQIELEKLLEPFSTRFANR